MNANVLGMLGVSNVGGRYVTGLPRAAQGPLGDDGSVMMISGLGADVPSGVDAALNRVMPGAGAAGMPVGGDLVMQLQQPITLFNITLPLWAWLLIAAALGGTVGWAALTRKKG